MLIYTVKKGDTLYAIANRYRITPELLAEINTIHNPDVLLVGQSLIIAKPTTVHTVSQGETVYSIARAYGITLAELYRKNPRLNQDRALSVGEVLAIRYEGEDEKPITVNGYAYPLIHRDILQKTLPYLSYISPFAYGLTSKGDLEILSDDTLLEGAKSQGVNLAMVLTSLNADGKFDNSITHSILEDESLRDYLISNLIALMMLKGYRTLTVDFQFLFPEDRDRFTAFLGAIKQAFAPYRYDLWVALPPKTDNSQNGLLFCGFDFEKIGEIADRILLMTYEWGYQFGKEPAIEPYPFVERAVSHALTKIDPKKLLLGVANYAYDFAEGEETRILSNEDALSLAERMKAEIQYDEIGKTPYFLYYDHSTRHRVYFEDARSIDALLKLVDAKNLAGISFWNIMHFFQQGYFLLNSYLIQ